jgi:cytidine deaminase
MQVLDVKIFIQIFTWDELSVPDQQLMQAARRACDTAYAPYSNFQVGAALLLQDESIVKGSNQENAAYPSGLCAERTAFFTAAVSAADQNILAVAVTARPAGSNTFVPVSPCGGCRQVMLEYEVKQKYPIRLVIQGEQDKFYVVKAIEDLLPLKFTDSQLVR